MDLAGHRVEGGKEVTGGNTGLLQGAGARANNEKEGKPGFTGWTVGVDIQTDARLVEAQSVGVGLLDQGGTGA